MITIFRNTMHGQWANCLLFFHIGETCIVIGGTPWGCDRGRWYGTGIELFTPLHKFRFLLGGYCDERRRRKNVRKHASLTQ